MATIANSPPSVESVRTEVGDIPAIEGMRGIAVLLVLVFHYFVLRVDRFPDDAFIVLARSWAPLEAIVRNGYLGVDLFFVITGFLLTLPWFRHAAEGRAAPGAKAFYFRRMRRIMPAYYVQLVILFFVVIPLLLPQIWMQSTPFVVANLGTHAVFMHYTTPLTSSSMTVNGALWTLAIEAQYYVLVPFIAPLFVRWPWRCLVAAVLIAGGWRYLANHDLDFLVRLYLKLGAKAGVTEKEVRHLIETQLPAWSLHFALGILAGRMWFLRRGAMAKGWSARVPVAIAGACAGLLLAILMAGTAFLGSQGWVAYPVLIAGAFAAVVSWPAAGLARVISVRPLAWVGRVSYSAYLYHLPVLLLFNAFLPGTPAMTAFVAWTSAVLVAAGLSYRFVETPYLRSHR